jgi:hypothetical protein
LFAGIWQRLATIAGFRLPNFGHLCRNLAKSDSGKTGRNLAKTAGFQPPSSKTGQNGWNPITSQIWQMASLPESGTNGSSPEYDQIPASNPAYPDFLLIVIFSYELNFEKYFLKNHFFLKNDFVENIL